MCKIYHHVVELDDNYNFREYIPLSHLSCLQQFPVLCMAVLRGVATHQMWYCSNDIEPTHHNCNRHFCATQQLLLPLKIHAVCAT